MYFYKVMLSLSIRGWLVMIGTLGLFPWMACIWYSQVFQEHPSVCYWMHSSWQKKPIPKHIHRTWKTKTIPAKFQKEWDNCIQLNPEYSIKLWTDEDLEKFIQMYYPWFLPTYRDYQYPIERVDAARYFILYHYGGIYMDMDVDCLQPFDVMFKNLSQITNADIITGAAQGGGLTNSFFATKARHPFFYLLLRLLISSKGWYLTPYFSVLLSTGPMFMTKVYYKYPCKEDIYILYQNNFTQHDHASTWHNDDGPLMIWIYYHSGPIITLFCLTIAAVIGVILYRRRLRHNKQNFQLPLKKGPSA